MPPATHLGIPPTRRQLEASRLNMAWLAVLAVAGVASLVLPGVPGNLSMLLVFATLVSASWTCGATALTFLSVRRLQILLPQLPREVRALDRVQVALSLANLKRFGPSLLSTVNFRVSSGEHALWVVPQVLPAIGAGAQAVLAWDVLIRKRGPLVIGPFVVRSEFPGSLVRVGLVFDYHREILVLPAEYQLTTDVLQVLAGRRQAGGRNAPVAGGAGEFAGVRQWRPGDPVRMIHRSLSLRSPDFPRQLVVRECENPATGDILVVLDNGVAPDDPLHAQLMWRLEKAICFVAALCKLLVAQKYRVHFLTHSRANRRVKIPLGGRRSELQTLDRALSRLQPAPKRVDLWTLPDPETLRTGSLVVYVSLRRLAEEIQHPGLSVVTISPDSIGPLTRRVVLP